MSQLEFENYIQKMKNRVKENDYKTAAKIADKIDWEKVDDINLLVFVSGIYEKIKDYESACAIMEYAYSIAPVKNRLYFPLCSINIKANNLKKAREYYIDFCESFQDDPRKNLLKYFFLKARGADTIQKIRVLSEYVEEEKEEDMVYELALLYDSMNDKENVIKLCDFIVDFFGVKLDGYGKDALNLKEKYVELNENEKKLLQNQSYSLEHRDDLSDDINYDLGIDDNIYEMKKTDPYEENIIEANKPAYRGLDDKERTVVEQIQRQVPEKKEEKNILDEEDNNSAQKKFVVDEDAYSEKELESTAFLNNDQEKKRLIKMINEIKTEKQSKYSTSLKQNKKSFRLNRRFDDMNVDNIKLHMIIESHTNEEGVKIAISELKYIHSALEENVKSAKVSAYSVNDNGFVYYLKKLGSRDLIIENAGRLNQKAIDDIEEFIVNSKNKNIIALVDVINNFDKLLDERPTFVERFDLYSVLGSENKKNVPLENKEEISKPKEIISSKEQEYEKNKIKQSTEEKPIKKIPTYDDNIEIRSNADLLNKVKIAKNKLNKKTNADDSENKKVKKDINKNPEKRKRNESEMTIDEFVNYCKNYADSIDCVIQGKTIPALYERVEEMIEEGDSLTEERAIEFMEDTADNADRKHLFKKPQYDKDDKLIIMEKHFA